MRGGKERARWSWGRPVLKEGRPKAAIDGEGARESRREVAREDDAGDELEREMAGGEKKQGWSQGRERWSKGRRGQAGEEGIRRVELEIEPGGRCVREERAGEEEGLGRKKGGGHRKEKGEGRKERKRGRRGKEE